MPQIRSATERPETPRRACDVARLHPEQNICCRYTASRVLIALGIGAGEIELGNIDASAEMHTIPNLIAFCWDPVTLWAPGSSLFPASGHSSTTCGGAEFEASPTRIPLMPYLASKRRQAAAGTLCVSARDCPWCSRCAACRGQTWLGPLL